MRLEDYPIMLTVDQAAKILQFDRKKFTTCVAGRKSQLGRKRNGGNQDSKRRTGKGYQRGATTLLEQNEVI